MNDSDEKLICTGERVIEDAYRTSASTYLIYLFHIATYNFCRPYIEGKKVLDFGCGSGYGTHLLSKYCEEITGVDISPEAVRFAVANYSNDNLIYRRIADIQTTPLPYPDSFFDVVISFQVMEHIEHAEKYLSEIKRVLKNDGIVIIATPDRQSRLFPGQKPWNQYHVREYAPEELRFLIQRHFGHCELFGMTARDDVVRIELKRTRLLRLLTWIFTFPGSPEGYRQFSLSLLKRLSRLVGSAYSQDRQEKSKPVDYPFSVDDIVIGKDAEPSVNIVCVAEKSRVVLTEHS